MKVTRGEESGGKMKRKGGQIYGYRRRLDMHGKHTMECKNGVL